jgi:uncharacterized membrane protein
MRRIVNLMAGVIDRIVWAVGCFTISCYLWEHWPLAYAVMAGGLIIGLGVWYCRKFFVGPFKAGLREE